MDPAAHYKAGVKTSPPLLDVLPLSVTCPGRRDEVMLSHAADGAEGRDLGTCFTARTTALIISSFDKRETV